MIDVIPVAILQRCNTSITHPIRPPLAAASQFQALDDPRRPTSAGLQVDEVAPVDRFPSSRRVVSLLSSTSFAASSPSETSFIASDRIASTRSRTGGRLDLVRNMSVTNSRTAAHSEVVAMMAPASS